jgi:hypothetical protein
VNAREREEGDVEGAAQLEYPDTGTVVVKQSKQPPQTFSFDRVFHDVSVTQVRRSTVHFGLHNLILYYI